LRFDQNVVRTADHHEVFDVVASYQNELTLPIKVKSINDTKPRLARPATTRHMKPAAERQTEYEQNQ
jgi:hypothetical protein